MSKAPIKFELMDKKALLYPNDFVAARYFVLIFDITNI